VIVHAVNLAHLYSVVTLVPELGVLLIGIAVQLLGLGAILVSKKQGNNVTLTWSKNLDLT